MVQFLESLGATVSSTGTAAFHAGIAAVFYRRCRCRAHMSIETHELLAVVATAAYERAKVTYRCNQRKEYAARLPHENNSRLASRATTEHNFYRQWELFL
jgi:hypothetical protein